MAETNVPTAQQVQKWANKIWYEYNRDNGFAQYSGGKGSGKVIIGIKELVDGGKTINIPFTPLLNSDGVRGNSVLTGNEADLQIYNEQVSVDYIRQAVKTKKSDGRFVGFDLYEASEQAVKDWFTNDFRNRIIAQMMSIRASGTGDNVLMGTITTTGNNGPYIAAADYIASEANKDTWLTNNTDRVQFGRLVSNSSSNDHSTSMATLDTTDDIMSSTVLSLSKRRAKQANPRIKPLRIDEGGAEWYVVFMGSRNFRDAKRDPVIYSANEATLAGGKIRDNPIFTGAEMIYDGLILKEIEEIPTLTAVGSSSADCALSFLCGQEAIGKAMGSDPSPIEELTDYKFRKGVGMEELTGLKKIFFGASSSTPKQHGVFTIATAAAADA